MGTVAWEELQNYVVLDRDGMRVGPVGQVYLADGSEEPRWVSVRTGFLGSKEVFVPLAEAETKDGKIQTPYSARLIRNAPSVDPDGHIDANEEIMLYHYYDIETEAGLAALEHAETLSDMID